MKKLPLYDVFKTRKEANKLANPLRKIKGNVVYVQEVDYKEMFSKAKPKKRYAVYSKK